MDFQEHFPEGFCHRLYSRKSGVSLFASTREAYNFSGVFAPSQLSPIILLAQPLASGAYRVKGAQFLPLCMRNAQSVLFSPPYEHVYANYVSLYSAAARGRLSNSLFHFSYSAQGNSHMKGRGVTRGAGMDAVFLGCTVSAGGRVIVGRVWEEKNGTAPGCGSLGILQRAWLKERVLFCLCV